MLSGAGHVARRGGLTLRTHPIRAQRLCRAVQQQLIEQAGLEIIGTGEADCPFEYADFEHLWRAQCSAGPFQAAIRSVGEERLKSAVACAVAPFFRDGGAIRLNNRFRYVVAARPGPAP